MKGHVMAAGYAVVCLMPTLARFVPKWLRKGAKR